MTIRPALRRLLGEAVCALVFAALFTAVGEAAFRVVAGCHRA